MSITSEIIKLRKSGMSLRKIALWVDKSRRTVAKLLGDHAKIYKTKKETVVHELIGWTTKEQRDKLAIDLYTKDGFGAHVTGRKLGITKHTVFGILRRHGIETDKNRKPRYANSLTEQQKSSLREMYQSGDSITVLAKRFGVGDNTVRYCLHGIKLRNPGDTMSKIPLVEQSKVLDLYVNEKWSSYQIAEYLNLPYQYIQKFLQRKGVSAGSFTKEWKERVQRGLKTPQSRLEKQLETIIVNIGCDYKQQQELGEFRFDFGINDGTILVDVQGSYWHTKPKRR